MPDPIAAPTTPAVAAPVAPPETVPPVAAPAAAPAPEAKKADDTRSRLAMQSMEVLKDKAALAKEREAFAAEKKAVEAEKAAHAALAKEKNLVALAKKVGMSDEDIAAALLNGGKVDAPPEDPRVAALAKELEDLKNTTKTLADARTADLTAAQQREIEAARQSVLAGIAEAKDATGADAYPWINALDQGALVVARIQKDHAGKKPEDVPDTAVEDAAKAVEAELAAQAPTYWKKVLVKPAVRALVETTLKDLSKGADAPAADAKKEPPPAAPTAKVETAKIAEAEAAKKTAPRWGVKVDAPAKILQKPKKLTFEEFSKKYQEEKAAAAKGGAA